MEQNEKHEAHEHHKKDEEHKTHETRQKKETLVTLPVIGLVVLVALVMLFNQFQIYKIGGMLGAGTFIKGSGSASNSDLSKINIDELKSTGHTVAAVFPLANAKTQEEIMAAMFPTGTPDYGESLGVSFDDAIGSLTTLSNMYRPLKAEVQKNNPEAWSRFMSLASKPVGLSCEYCCGIGKIGIDKDGNSACGCQHNPAILAVTLYLTAYTDYNDGEILREAMKWKTLFFPKNMIELGMTVAGGDTSALDKLPGMVGGC